MARLLKVAVIGAGVSGLTTARELQREGHQVVVYEKADQIGGTWVYTARVEDDPLGINPHRKIVHSSLYTSLRTNLPRCLMGFSDYPFRVRENGQVTNFPGHEEVLKFLKDFARDFGLVELIRFNTEVVRVEQVSLKDDQWIVESRTSDGLSSEELFEAVVICNGHNTQPRLAELAGIKNWPGKQIHSHNYRVPETFRNLVVIVIGFGPSALDIALEVAEVAKEVHLSSRDPGIEASKLKTHDNLWLHSQVDYCYENGEVAFKDGASAAADIIIHCTGTDGIVSIDDNRVGPLYKHVFPPELSPRLSFVGTPRRSINFPMIELQAKCIAHVASGKVLLPSKEKMLADVQEHYQLMAQNGVPKHHTHTLLPDVGEYMDWLAAQVVQPRLDRRLVKLFVNIGKAIRASWIGFRERIDNWDSICIEYLPD